MKDAEDVYKRIKKDYYKRKDLRHCLFFSIVNCANAPFKLYHDSLSYCNERALFTKLIYAYFRELDDIVDGDKEIISFSGNFTYDKQKKFDYLLRRMDFVTNPVAPDNDMDVLMKKIFELSEHIGIDVSNEIQMLLESLLFDLWRTCDIKNGEILTSSKQELEKYYFDYYMACHKIGVLMSVPNNGEDISAKNLKTLGYARRNYFILRDFLEDINSGLINIPSEEMDYDMENIILQMCNMSDEYMVLFKKKGFNSLDVLPYLDDKIVSWLDKKLEITLGLLEDYQQNAPLRLRKDIIKEVLFYQRDLSDLIIRIMLEYSTNNYLTRLERQRVNIKNKKFSKSLV